MSENKKTVAVAGAIGRAGGLIIEEALERDFNVRALLIKSFDQPEQPKLTSLGVDLVFARPHIS